MYGDGQQLATVHSMYTATDSSYTETLREYMGIALLPYGCSLQFHMVVRSGSLKGSLWFTVGVRSGSLWVSLWFSMVVSSDCPWFSLWFPKILALFPYGVRQMRGQMRARCA